MGFVSNSDLKKAENFELLADRCQLKPWTDFKPMVVLYRALNDNQTLDVRVNGVPTRLDGLRVSRTEIESLLNQEPGIDEMFIMIGAKEVGLPPNEQFLTAILAAVKNNEVLLKTSTKEYKVLEFCDPCPDQCFNNFGPGIALP